METVATRLKLARENAGLNLSEAAKKLNLSPSAVHQWESGTTAPRKKALEAAAKIYNVSPVWLNHGENPSFGAPIVPWEHPSELTDDFVFVARCDIRVSAGNGIVVYDECEQDEPQSFRLSWLKKMGMNPDNVRVVYAHGNSMAPGINEGDSLTIDTSRRDVKSSHVYVIRIEDEVSVKRLFKRPGGGLEVQSDNKDHPTRQFTAEESQNIEIIGEVMHKQSTRI
ncbi:LexA family transcriptional regulator [Chrysiogenes arsenatis]|uniref:LexA family transcriptional regulator n=1 Tax=Chrysiogenes arsenatis TaxID=309797 RepID=UPI0003F50777|nr:XRE family transcriptional regulator [Chrysiogenes arsenatis]